MKIGLPVLKEEFHLVQMGQLEAMLVLELSRSEKVLKMMLKWTAELLREANLVLTTGMVLMILATLVLTSLTASMVVNMSLETICTSRLSLLDGTFLESFLGRTGT